jgi:hypothetical protein
VTLNRTGPWPEYLAGTFNEIASLAFMYIDTSPQETAQIGSVSLLPEKPMQS